MEKTLHRVQHAGVSLGVGGGVCLAVVWNKIYFNGYISSTSNCHFPAGIDALLS